MEGSLYKVKYLLNAGADVEVKDTVGRTALMWASMHGRKEVVQVLLAVGADVEVKDNDGLTALMYASRNGCKDVVQVLLAAGADVEVKDKWGRTALMWALRYGYKEIAQMLKDAGVKEPIREHYNRLNKLMPSKSKEQIEKDLALLPKEKLNELLLNAAIEGSVIKVRYLLDAGAYKNAKDKEGWTTLMLASYNNYKDIVQALLDVVADINVKNTVGNTALIYASRDGFLNIVQLLIDAGADINIKNKYGKTALQIASDNEFKEIVQVLLDTGSDSDSVNEEFKGLKIYKNADNTYVAKRNDVLYSFMWVPYVVNNFKKIGKIGKNYVITAKLLHTPPIQMILQIQRKISLNENFCIKPKFICEYLEFLPKSKEQIEKDLVLLPKKALNKLFIDAACEGSVIKVRYLLDAGADIEAKNKYGITALMYASSKGDEKAVQLLLDAGADVNAKDNWEETAFQYALKWNYVYIAQILKDAGAKEYYN
jgi:ankyrin repeat protein